VLSFKTTEVTEADEERVNRTKNKKCLSMALLYKIKGL